MHSNPMKFEHESRVRELDMVNSLKKLGLDQDQVVCDYGAGTGIFTVEAARLTRGKVYALDMDPAMIALVEEKVKVHGLSNVRTVTVKADQLPLEAASVDLLLLATVLHEIEDVPTFVEGIKRVLKPKGKVMVIDFYKKETPMGPPVEARISAYQAARHFFREGINLDHQYALGDNLYLLAMSH